jgi:hypothetical protein
VFVLRCLDEELSKVKMPLIIDPTGVYWRPEGSGCVSTRQQERAREVIDKYFVWARFIAGVSPLVDPDAHDDFDVDHSLFEEVIWPVLAHRLPAFEALKGA